MTTADLLAAFTHLRVLVAGDVCLDRWCRYDPRLADPSRETGIPRVAVVETAVTPGAAGTVANNAAALGAGRVDVLGAVGDDGFGYELAGALAARNIGTDLLLRASGIPTFTYTKLLNAASGVEDLPRIDFVNSLPLGEETDRSLVTRFEEAAPDFDVILVSDQAETTAGGVVTPRFRAALARVAARCPDTVIWVDSRMRAEHFRGVIVKANRQEAEDAARRALGCMDFPAFRKHIEAPLLIVTKGGDGARIVRHNGEDYVPTVNIAQPVDICGAGDSFSAGAALALAVIRDPLAAAEFGNRVAAITIMKPGTGVATPAELAR